MTRHDVKAMIGDFREIENEKLLEEIIENYQPKRLLERLRKDK